MRIRHLSFVGIRSLPSIKQGFPPSGASDLIVAYGKFACGKTTFLDTIAAAKERIAPYGSPDSRWDSLVAPSVPAAKVSIQWEASDVERARFALEDGLLPTEVVLGTAAGKERHPLSLQGILTDRGSATNGSIHYLHDTRDLDGPLSFGGEDASVRLRLTARNAKFAELYDVLDQSPLAAAKRLATERLSELCPNLEIVGMQRSGASLFSILKDRETGVERRLDTLSLSEQQAFILALYTSRYPIVDSIVLVDAPELGFGDGAVEYLRALLRWTTRTQVIAATSVAAVRDMPEVGHVIELRK